MRKPKENPFQPRSIRWALLEEDWSDLTVDQIAEVFGTKDNIIYQSIRVVKQKTGYSVPYTPGNKGRKKAGGNG